MNKNVRVRFAPSPTGPLHIGGVRTALYNYLFAKCHEGKFLLRIEDTDQGRFVPGAEEYILESLRWAGIMPDEGVGVGGPHAPYRQSERKAIYRQYADQLVAEGNAYYAFDTPEELDELRKELEAAKSGNTSYNFNVRGIMKNSLTLSADETQRMIDGGVSYVIRIKMPENEKLVIYDQIRGQIEVNTSTLDDKVLFKSDGLPTYHLANVVDDHLMEITHVIRGEEWLPSMPLHVILYRCFGWEETMPEFAHLPLLLKPDGKGKLSKRDGDKLGFPVFPLLWKDPFSGEESSGYRESGYFPEAFLNILAFLGWNPGTTQEIFSLEELVQQFSLANVHKAGARFDPDKAKWFNHQYLVMQTDEYLTSLFQVELRKHGVESDQEFVQEVIRLVKDRANFVHDLWGQASFFFVAPESYDTNVVAKRWKPETGTLILALIDKIKRMHDFTAGTFYDEVHTFMEDRQINPGYLMNCIRLALVGGAYGPDLPVIVGLLGKDQVLSRLLNAEERLG